MRWCHEGSSDLYSRNCLPFNVIRCKPDAPHHRNLLKVLSRALNDPPPPLHKNKTTTLMHTILAKYNCVCNHIALCLHAYQLVDNWIVQNWIALSHVYIYTVGTTTIQKCFACQSVDPQRDLDGDTSMWPTDYHSESCNYGPDSIHTCNTGEVLLIHILC